MSEKEKEFIVMGNGVVIVGDAIREININGKTAIEIFLAPQKVLTVHYKNSDSRKF